MSPGSPIRRAGITASVSRRATERTEFPSGLDPCWTPALGSMRPRFPRSWVARGSHSEANLATAGPGSLPGAPFTPYLEVHAMLRQMLFLAALLPALAHAQTTDKVLQRIRDTKKVSIAYRTDAKPFSYEDGGKPAGYTVELCKRIVASLEQQLKVCLLYTSDA